MSQPALDELTQRLITGWDDAVPLRVVFLLIGAVIVYLTSRAALKNRCSLVVAALWLLFGVLLVAFAVWPQQIIEFIVSRPYMTRIRVIIAALSLLMLFITLESIRRTHLQERYALLWVATGLVLLVAALFPGVVALFRAVTGSEYATAVVAVAFAFLILVAFHFSISMSAGQTRQTRLAQRLALLEARLEQLEEKVRGE
jgi:hypothetical protein